MSAKTILPILGVGSAFAILGLAAARRKHGERIAREGVRERRLESGTHPRVALDGDADDVAFTPAPLTSEFWDAAPESSAILEQSSRPGASLDSYDAIDTEDLSAEWLARATEAPALADEPGSDDADDPAEIPADSLSMISDASRRAAAFDDDDEDPSSGYELPRT
jgi:hypothetical protein